MIPMGIAAGHIKRPAQIVPLLKVPADMLSSVTFGSYTPLPRDGNPGETFWVSENGTSLNALGLPNQGIDAACKFLPEAMKALRDHGKVPRVSLAGFCIQDYVHMTSKLLEAGYTDEVELNLGCPNVCNNGKQKSILAFQPEVIRAIIEAVGVLGVGDRLSVKLSPYTDPSLLIDVAETIANCTHKVAIVTSNTFGNGSAYDTDGKLVITANNGYGGVAGTDLHNIAVGQVRQFIDFLPPDADIIGVGGISDGRSLRDFELAGASAAQVGTAFFVNEDPRIFQEIAGGYLYLREKQE